MKNLEIKIKKQGAPIVSHGFLYREGSEVVALTIGMETTHCDVHAAAANTEGIPEIVLIGTALSSNLYPEKEYVDYTSIVFLEYKDWEVWSVKMRKRRLDICLVKS